jgi:nucleoside-diphosphate-sugar epimerase
MKIILSGGTGVLGSEIIFEFLEYFIENRIEGKLYLIARGNAKITAAERVNTLLSSSFVPQKISKIGLEVIKSFIEVIDSSNITPHKTLIQNLSDAYFIHSAGFVNLSTDAQHYDSIYNENKKVTESFLSIYGPHIKKFIYVSTAYCTGVRAGLISNDFHNLDFEPQFRNAYENAKFESEKYVARYCTEKGIEYQILRPSVIGGKLMSEENRFHVLKYMGFYLLGKFFHFYSKSKKNENVRIPITFDTGLNIIPVDYVAKVIVKSFQRNDIIQLNIAHNKSYDIAGGIKIIMEEAGHINFNLVPLEEFKEYQNVTERLYFEKIGKHLSPYLNAPKNEYDTELLNSILPIPEIDAHTFRGMIRYGVVNNFSEVSI